MTDLLFKFYINKRRYLKAFSLAIKDGDLDKAWEVVEAYGGGCYLPEQQKIQVFNYVQAKHLLTNLAKEPEQIFSPNVSWASSCPWLSDSSWLPVQDFWEDLEQTINALWRQEIAYKSITFAEKWMKQLFDITVRDLCELAFPDLR